MPDLTKESDKTRQQDASMGKLAGRREELSAAAAAAPVAAQARTAEIGKLFEQLKTLAANRTEGLEPRASQQASKVQDMINDIGESRKSETLQASTKEREVRETLAAAFDSLDRRQSRELKATADKPQSAVEALGRDHQQQREDLASVARHAEEAMQRNTQDMRNRQQSDAARIGADLHAPDQLSALAQEAGRVDQEAVETGRTQCRLLDYVKERSQSIVVRPSTEQMQDLRSRTGLSADKLDDAAMQRILDSAKAKDAQEREEAMRGQITEELNNERVEDEVRKKGNPDDQFIAGHRIRTAHGQQLSDGIIARRQQDGRLEPTKGFEVKAGGRSARDLRYKLDRDKDMTALLRAARDAAEDEQRRRLEDDLKAADPDSKALHEALDDALKTMPGPTEDAVQRHFRELQLPAAQREAGQLSQTSERLTEERLFVDGVELQRVEDANRRRVPVQAVLAKDTPYTLPALRLDEDEAQIRKIAKAFNEARDSWRRH